MFRKSDRIERDERTIAVEHKSYTIGFRATMYALLVDIMVRSFYFREPSWDLFGVVILCSLIPTLYQLNHRVLTKTWVKVSIIGVVTSVVIAAVVALAKNALF